ncbi:hypothetical protein EDC94DRAFT_79906 [Helicostylum pulchrum]|uniref:Uncharacterized protein n=1 Tax=Helicostylum pulchrum TaxID=562976 RepID=A0ABP9XJ54_9FUNG|nr:hypothetical protein EDC94DRAFT_79906 [Helicostylum pulchrum]
MVIPCLPKKEPTIQQVSSDDELHAFDLTWKNYLPSISQFCCCVRKAGVIRLDDEDPLIEPAYYNDHTLYRGEALQNYLDNPRDWEFESVLGQNDLPHFVTRNPFGTQSIKKKKKSKKQKKRERPVVMETDMEEGDIMGYDIDNHQEDAEFLGDDQIANLAYNRHSSQLMDQYGEELYYQNIQGPTIQEMQAPPREFYAAKTMPQINFEQENDEDYEERIVAASSSDMIKPQASVDAAQALLSDRLDDLTEKLSFIKKNIIHMKPTQEDDDTTTLHTLNDQDNTLVEQNSVCSDIDSITSAALDVYENTTVAFENQQQQQQQHHQRRYSSSDELHLPSLTDNTPFVSDQHPFTYFNNHSTLDEEEEEEQENTTNVRNMVFGFGKKWLGV